MFRRKDRIEIKTAAQLEVMRAAGLVVGTTLIALRDAVTPGITTGQLDGIQSPFGFDQSVEMSFESRHRHRQRRDGLRGGISAVV